MLINIESFGHQLSTFVSVFDGSHQRIFTVCPFGDFRVHDAAIADGFLWCVKSDRGNKNGSGEVCQIDLNSGAVLARRTHSIVQPKITFAPISGVLLIYGLGNVAGFRLAPFDRIWEIKGAFGKVTERRWFWKRTTYRLFDDRDMSVENSKRSRDDLLCVGVPIETSEGPVRTALAPRGSFGSLQERTDYRLNINPLSGAYEIEPSRRKLGHQVVIDPPQFPSILKPIKYKSVALPELTLRDIEAYLKGLTRLKNWKQASVSKGLVALSARLEAGIDGVSRLDGCELVFVVGNSMMDEWAFFEKLRTKNVDVLQDVRVLLGAWLDALETSGRGFPSTDENDNRAAGPMTGALGYLISSGSPCGEIVRRFTILRIGEQEAYSRDVLLTEYINRHAPGSKYAIALKVFFIFLRERDGRMSILENEDNYGWHDLGILKGARESMLPSDFVDLVLGELSYFTQEKAQFSHDMKVGMGPISGLLKLLKTDNHWDGKVEALLRGMENIWH